LTSKLYAWNVSATYQFVSLYFNSFKTAIKDEFFFTLSSNAINFGLKLTPEIAYIIASPIMLIFALIQLFDFYSHRPDG